MTTQTHYRQGDVFIERVAKVPKTAKAQKPGKVIVLALGTATGHHHALESKTAVEWWQAAPAPAVATEKSRKEAGLARDLYFTLTKPAEVVHPEHSAFRLPEGVYRVMRQREYSPEAIRNVAD
jgi:hypothetical protein